MNILVTLDENYIPYFNVMIASLVTSNPDRHFTVYLLNRGIREDALRDSRKILGKNGEIVSVIAKDIGLSEAPTTSRYPEEIYYRIFASRYLDKSIDKVLYLDPDVIVNRPLDELYETDLSEYYFAAASHTGVFLRKFNEIRLDMEEDSPYINSGVMLMNLKRLRQEQNFNDVFEFIKKRKNLLMLPDQDIISSLYGSKIYALDTFRYNMTERLFMAHAPFERDLDLDWIRQNSVIIHYCGRNKPWKPIYHGQLDIFYKEAEERMKILLEERSKTVYDG